MCYSGVEIFSTEIQGLTRTEVDSMNPDLGLGPFQLFTVDRWSSPAVRKDYGVENDGPRHDLILVRVGLMAAMFVIVPVRDGIH